MELMCQNSAISQLDKCVKSDSHSILIDGPIGSGKSYLAKMFASMKNISDVVSIQPTVQSVRDMIEECIDIDNPVVMIIENIDEGVLGTSYSLLKFLEEPKQNTYIIVTCRNIKFVPATILSRSFQISLSGPTDTDIASYAKSKDAQRYQMMSAHSIWKVVKNLVDVDTLYNMDRDNLQYFESIQLPTILKDSVSSVVWSLMHYPDNSASPLSLVIRYILKNTSSNHIKQSCIDCLNDLDTANIGTHAIISKFVLECKYGGG